MHLRVISSALNNGLAVTSRQVIQQWFVYLQLCKQPDNFNLLDSECLDFFDTIEGT